MAKENKKVKNSVLIDLFYEDGLRTGERSGEKKGIQKGMQEKEIALIVKKCVVERIYKRLQTNWKNRLTKSGRFMRL